MLAGTVLLAEGRELSPQSLTLCSGCAEIGFWSLCCQTRLCFVHVLVVGNPGSWHGAKVLCAPDNKHYIRTE